MIQDDTTETLTEEQTDAALEEILNPDTITPEDLSDTHLERIAQLEASLARSQADYQNLLMRVERDKADLGIYLSSKILLPLLPSIDNLERAVKLKDGVEGDTFIDGVRSVMTGMRKYLESQNVTAFDSLGSEVDPSKHEVMVQMPGKEGIIVQEFETGYMIGNKVLRYAKVVVGNGE